MLAQKNYLISRHMTIFRPMRLIGTHYFASTYMRGRGKGIFAFGAYVTGVWSSLYVWRSLEYNEPCPYTLYTPLRPGNVCGRL